MLALVMSMTPPTSKTTIRLDWLTASASDPAPDALRLVTCTTFPPRPPVALAAKPSAPGKAGCCALNVCIVRSRSVVRARIVFFITSMLDELLYDGYKVTYFFPIMFC